MGKLPHGGDLLGEITDICTREDIRLGRIEAIGSVARARLAYYHQETKEYRYYTLSEPLEIASLTGNVSLKEGRPFVHAHLTLTDTRGNCRGGHLAAGTTVYACEFLIEVFDGPTFARGHDRLTGLHLWKIGDEGG